MAYGTVRVRVRVRVLASGAHLRGHSPPDPTAWPHSISGFRLASFRYVSPFKRLTDAYCV